MGIYGALSTAVTGLRAQSHALENISGNIANSQTVGYKRIETSFKDLIADAPVKSQVPGAVLGESRATNNLQGDIQTNSNETFIALNASGFFVVEPKAGQSDGNPLFAGTNYFTRRGDFEIDKDGLLVNGAGYYLKGLPIDTATGNISGSVPEVIRISNAYLPANVTRNINYQANLPQVPKTANYNSSTPNSELLQSWSYSTKTGVPHVPGTSTGWTIPINGSLNVPARATGAQLVGTAAASPHFTSGQTMTVTINGITQNLRFGTGTTPTSAVQITATGAASALDQATTSLVINPDDLAALKALGSFSIGGQVVNTSAVNSPAEMLTAIQAATNAAGGVVTHDAATNTYLVTYAAAQRPADTLAIRESFINVENMTVSQALASMQNNLRAVPGGDANMTVQLRNGRVEMSTSNNNTAAMTLQTHPSTAGVGVFGLADGTTNAKNTGLTASDVYGDLVFAQGDNLKLTIGTTVVDYVIDLTGDQAVGAGQTKINGAQTIDKIVADIQTDLRTNGGPGAKNARVGFENGQFVVSLDDNYLYDLEIEGTAGARLNVNGEYTAVTGSVTEISGDDAAKFIGQTISGGAITVYASNGAQANVQMRWAKVDSAATGGKDTWRLFYLTDSNAVGNATAWKAVGQDYIFNQNGSLSPSISEAEINNLTINGVTIGNVKLIHQDNGLSQFADVNGSVSVSTLNQNGYGAGEFLSVAITDEGRVVASYSNGERLEMAQVATAQFNGVNALKRLDGGVFQATAESGEPIIDLSGSGIIGSALEASNTDISDEFTKLIITQQAYSAGTRIVSAADEMLQEVLNMIR